MALFNKDYEKDFNKWFGKEDTEHIDNMWNEIFKSQSRMNAKDFTTPLDSGRYYTGKKPNAPKKKGKFNVDKMPGLAVKFAANKWEVIADECMDQLRFVHPDSHDDQFRISRRGDEVREVQAIMLRKIRESNHEKQFTQAEQLETLIWLLINKGILYYPVEILN